MKGELHEYLEVVLLHRSNDGAAAHYEPMTRGCAGLHPAGFHSRLSSRTHRERRARRQQGVSPMRHPVHIALSASTAVLILTAASPIGDRKSTRLNSSHLV